MHKFEGNFIQIKSPHMAMVTLELSRSEEYSTEDLSTLGQKEFRDENPWNSDANTFHIGNFRERFLRGFRDKDDQPCDLWKYFGCRKLNVTKQKLYLYSEPQIKFEDPSEGIDSPKVQLTTSGKRPHPKEPDDGKRRKKQTTPLTFASLRRMTGGVSFNNLLSADIPKSPAPQDSKSTLSAASHPSTSCNPPNENQTVRIYRDIKNSDRLNLPLPIVLLEEDSNDTSGTLRDRKTDHTQDQVVPISALQLDNPTGQQPSGEDASPIGIETCCLEDAPEVEVFYHWIKESQYTKELSVREVEKRELFSLLQVEQRDLLDCNLSSFEPLEWGFRICRIVRNKETLLHIFLTPEGEKEFTFPSTDLSTYQPHTLLYDSGYLNGCCGGAFGVGAIPYCTEECKPKIRWDKNGERFKEGTGYYWLDGVVEPDEIAVWKCSWTCSALNDSATVDEICQSDSPEIQKSADSSEEYEDVLELEEETIEHIERELQVLLDDSPDQNLQIPIDARIESELGGSKTSSNKIEESLAFPDIDFNLIDALQGFINTRPSPNITNTFPENRVRITSELLGVGDHSLVYKGIFGTATPIAIKVVKLDCLMDKSKPGDARYLKYVTHPDVIQALELIIVPKFLYIVMPLYISRSLSDILWSGVMDYRHLISTVEKKNSIGAQICRIMEYLHIQDVPIIHQAMKCENVLLNSHGEVKLCDFSIHHLVSTTSVRSVMHMAPELIIAETAKVYTIHSDIWALGCTLVELYRESHVWNFKFGNPKSTLQEIFEKTLKPDMRAIPQGLVTQILECFEYDPLKRTSLRKMICAYEKIFQ